MPLVTTAAVVLQTHRYSETSKIVRLATRDLGVQSAIAKGVLRPKSRFGAALEFLSEGEAQLYFRDARELHTLAVFDVITLRRGLAEGVARFAGGAAAAEVMLKMAPPSPLPAAYATLTAGLDQLATVPAAQVDATAVRTLWTLMAVLGFAVSLTECVRDGGAIDPDAPVAFSAAEGGVLCARCAPPHPPTRLPPEDYRGLIALNDPGAALPMLDAAHAAAHRRLVARFVQYHIDVAPTSLSALDFWERHAWTPPRPKSAAS
ncbi:MAG TPA: DNA repair protein RecO [Gemmatimonadales bacterium]|nr:DNA repair protein RecO [Gemmatimonadales bacterium]